MDNEDRKQACEMVSASVVTNQALWQALREEVPTLPEATAKAVLRADLHQASLEWEEPSETPDGVYSLVQMHRWTKPEADRLWLTLFEKLGRLPGMREIRIELRDLQQSRAIEIEGRLLWLREADEMPSE